MISAMPATSTRETVRSRRGMSLVELLISMSILVIIGIIVVSLFVNYLNLFIANNDVVAAGQRADTVFRLLHEPVLHAGIGIDTSSPDKYAAAWGNKTYPDVPEPAGWGDAIVLSGDEVEEIYSEIGVLYAVPTGLKISQVPDPGFHFDNFDFPLIDHQLPANLSGITGQSATPPNPEDMRSWLVFPATDTEISQPMLIKSYDHTGKKLTVSPVPQYTYRNQEFFRMKAVKAYLSGTTFHLIEVTDGTDHEGSSIAVVDGIRAIRYKLSADRKYLDVRVLAMGDSVGAKHTQTPDPGLRARWEELGTQDAGQYFQEFSTKWRVRNLAQRP